MRKTQKCSLSLLVVMICFVSVTAVSLADDTDPCKEQGITVKNLSLKEMWYKQKGGACTILKRNYFFVIKPEQEISLFSDLICETPYCLARKYTDYRSYDTDGNCRVRILSGNTLSDM